MNQLYIGNLRGLLTFPGWIEDVVDTLESLQIYELPNLKTLPECLTRMTRLKRLQIFDCPQLLSLPSDLHRLTFLENLIIYDCPKLFQKYQPQLGEYWHKIAHINNIEVEE
jgi:hypothetical protein